MALSPFSRPFHHFPWHISGQKPQLLTSTGERARKVVKGPPCTPGRADRARGTAGRADRPRGDPWPGGRTAGTVGRAASTPGQGTNHRRLHPATHHHTRPQLTTATIPPNAAP